MGAFGLAQHPKTRFSSAWSISWREHANDVAYIRITQIWKNRSSHFE
jgi:hypothetical protein